MVAELDKQFGPQLAGYFDFTLLFGQTIFEIAPDALLILATPFYATMLVGRLTQQVQGGPLLWIKVAIGTLLIAVYIAKAVLWQTISGLQSPSSVAESVVCLVGSTCTLVILYGSHLYNRRLSSFVSLFFTLTMLLDISLARSYFLRYDMDFKSLHKIGAIQIIVVLLKLCLVILEEVPKTPLSSDDKDLSATKSDFEIGFWSRVVFSWVNKLLLYGFNHELDVDHLPRLDEEFDSRRMFDKFFAHWSQCMVHPTVQPE